MTRNLIGGVGWGFLAWLFCDFVWGVDINRAHYLRGYSDALRDTLSETGTPAELRVELAGQRITDTIMGRR